MLLSVYGNVDACTAQAECANGESIACIGDKECLSGSTWTLCKNQDGTSNRSDCGAKTIGGGAVAIIELTP